jgi:hypothetical protein
VLVGRNNEGKSNLLRALRTALEYSKSLGNAAFHRGRLVSTRRLRGALGDSIYTWEDDFPLALQSQATGETVFRLWFRLDESERKEFRKSVGSNLRTDLPVEIRLGASSSSFRVKMPGPGASALSNRREEVARFIADRLVFEYIPAVRTAESAQAVVSAVLARELSIAERDPDYQAALARIDELQRPILDRVGAEIKRTLGDFLPDVRQVDVRISADVRSMALRRSVEIVVDDGTPTPLEYKGDGVQSIAALSLMRAASSARAESRNLILAIEEPEAHLHPGAAHQLRAVLQDLAGTAQIVMTTHNPVFVDRRSLSSNIVVQDSRARPAESFEQIRECLGVQASDNLRHADVVLIVEGDTDRTILEALMRHASPRIGQMLDTGRFAIIVAGGSHRIVQQAGVVKAALCDLHVLADFDEAGRQAVEEGQRRLLFAADEVTLISCRGQKEAELEDMLDPYCYAAALKDSFGVGVPCDTFDRSHGKWSRRMETTFLAQGSDWGSQAQSVKSVVESAVASNPAAALHSSMRGPFDALVQAIESRFT